ncbi:MAG: hypothetical protein WDZ35_10870 [Crocinitomicaceae bacterium]
MNKLVLTLFLFPSVIGYGNEEDIQQIKEWYKQIEDNLDNCVKVPLTAFYDEDYVTGGSSDLEGYIDTTTNQLVKIIEHTYYDWAEDVNSYYFHEGNLFFIFSHGNYPGEMYTAEELEISEDELWQRGGEAKTINYYERRVYYKSAVCIRHQYKEKEYDVEAQPDLKLEKNDEPPLADDATKDLFKHGSVLYRAFQVNLKK